MKLHLQWQTVQAQRTYASQETETFVHVRVEATVLGGGHGSTNLNETMSIFKWSCQLIHDLLSSLTNRLLIDHPKISLDGTGCLYNTLL